MFHTGSGAQIAFTDVPDAILDYYNKHKDPDEEQICGLFHIKTGPSGITCWVSDIDNEKRTPEKTVSCGNERAV